MVSLTNLPLTHPLQFPPLHGFFLWLDEIPNSTVPMYMKQIILRRLYKNINTVFNPQDSFLSSLKFTVLSKLYWHRLKWHVSPAIWSCCQDTVGHVNSPGCHCGLQQQESISGCGEDNIVTPRECMKDSFLNARCSCILNQVTYHQADLNISLQGRY